MKGDNNMQDYIIVYSEDGEMDLLGVTESLPEAKRIMGESFSKTLETNGYDGEYFEGYIEERSANVAINEHVYSWKILDADKRISCYQTVED